MRQHADNPADWYPWGEEAFARARQEDRPIFLPVGYSACHSCHVEVDVRQRGPHAVALAGRAADQRVWGTAEPTMGALSGPVGEPAEVASPKV